KATDIIVSLRMTTNAATERIPITRNGLTGVVVVEDTAAPTFHTVLLPDHDTTVPRRSGKRCRYGETCQKWCRARHGICRVFTPRYNTKSPKPANRAPWSLA